MTGAFLIYQTSPKTCLVVALVDGVDVPEWLYVSAGGEHDVLGAGVPRDEVGDVVDAAPVRHPHPRLGVVVLPNILMKRMKPQKGGERTLSQIMGGTSHLVYVIKSCFMSQLWLRS